MRAADLLRRYRRLTRAERRVARRSACLLVAARLTLDWTAPETGLAWWRRPPRTRVATLAPARIAWLVEAVATRLPFHTSCLARAAVAARLVADTGQPGALVIGADRSAVGFAAHAWLEVDGAVTGPPPADRYQPVARWMLPPPPAA